MGTKKTYGIFNKSAQKGEKLSKKQNGNCFAGHPVHEAADPTEDLSLLYFHP